MDQDNSIDPTCRSPLEAQFFTKVRREGPSLARPMAEAQKLVFPAANLLAQVPCAQHKIQPQPDLWYCLMDLEPSCRDGKPVDMDVHTWLC